MTTAVKNLKKKKCAPENNGGKKKKNSVFPFRREIIQLRYYRINIYIFFSRERTRGGVDRTSRHNVHCTTDAYICRHYRSHSVSVRRPRSVLGFDDDSIVFAANAAADYVAVPSTRR